MANSKFENFILVRNISAPQKYKDMWNREAEFMMSFPQFAICNQDDETIYSDSNRLDEYYEKMVEDGSFEYTEPIDINEDDIVRMQEVNLLKLGIEEENIPEQIKLLPITAKLYNDRNMSEYNFYMQEDWYPVTVGDVHIEETSQIGGSVTVTKIEESDDDITFYYEKNGYVPEFIYLEVRVKNDKLNYYSPFETEIKGIDGEENKFVFTKDVEKMTGAPLVGYERTNNASELEFALFYNVKYEILAEPLTFEWEKTENSEVATIENIEFSEFVNDINESLHDMNVAQNYSGIITEMSDKTLKFYSDIFKKDLILSYPAEFEYTNKRTNQKLEFKDIKVGDYLMFERVNGGNFDEGQFMVIRNLKGEALKEELLLQMNPYAERLGVEFVYREAKNVEIVDENNAIITYEFSDMYQFRLGNSEKFEIKVLVNSDTKICRDATWDWEPIQIRDLETIEYEPARVMICLNQATINDEMPVAESVELGFPAEEF